MNITPQQIDDLVAGNLSGRSYRELLESFEAQPHRWRDCALAFLREQAIQQDLQALVAGNMLAGSPAQVDLEAERLEVNAGEKCESSHSMSSHVANAASNFYVESEELMEEIHVARGRGLSSAGLGVRLLALAALLLISFTIGWVGSAARESSFGESVASDTMLNQLNTATESMGAIESDLQPSNETDSSTVAPPRREFFASSQLMPIDRQVPEPLRELERQGRIRIESYDAIVPVELEDGTSAIVPIQQFQLVPVVYSY